MEEDQIKAELLKAREQYFQAADAALEKIRLGYGEGKEGFRNFLNGNKVEKIRPKKLDKN
ncbi:MAG: hypothetical protein ACOY5B_18840 [Spirochaetota bacterium]